MEPSISTTEKLKMNSISPMPASGRLRVIALKVLSTLTSKKGCLILAWRSRQICCQTITADLPGPSGLKRAVSFNLADSKRGARVTLIHGLILFFHRRGLRKGEPAMKCRSRFIALLDEDISAVDDENLLHNGETDPVPARLRGIERDE